MNNDYTERLQKIETELNRWLPEKPEAAWAEKVFPGLKMKDPRQASDLLIAPLKDILSRGGKRWRPLLMTLICETLGGGDTAIPLAPLVEFSHNASLIHDDIEDNSDERRGKPAIHKIYGIDTAINSGSFFYFLSVCCIESCAYEDKAGLYRLWAEYMRKLHFGQSMDISWHQDIKYIPSAEEYYAMCGMKTGCLARFAAELGAVIAGASQDTVRQMGDTAEKLGIGFQILDDVKNLTTGIPGKKRGDDIIEGKKSLPVIFYLNKYPEKRERIFYCFHEAKIYGYAVPEVEEMLDTLNEAGSIKEAEEQALSFINQAHGVFNAPLMSGLIDLIS